VGWGFFGREKTGWEGGKGGNPSLWMAGKNYQKVVKDGHREGKRLGKTIELREEVRKRLSYVGVSDAGGERLRQPRNNKAKPD